MLFVFGISFKYKLFLKEGICRMKRMLLDTTKVFIVFIVCTCLFYYGLRMMHAEYEQYHRYDTPDGPAIKVFHDAEDSFIKRLNLFFRLGE